MGGCFLELRICGLSRRSRQQLSARQLLVLHKRCLNTCYSWETFHRLRQLKILPSNSKPQNLLFGSQQLRWYSTSWFQSSFRCYKGRLCWNNKLKVGLWVTFSAYSRTIPIVWINHSHEPKYCCSRSGLSDSYLFKWKTLHCSEKRWGCQNFWPFAPSWTLLDSYSFAMGRGFLWRKPSQPGYSTRLIHKSWRNERPPRLLGLHW